MSYSSSARQKIATRIEKLTKQKALSEDQLLHLQFIFSRDDSVKILADRTRRLIRIDKYNDNTLDQVVKFLDVVENQAISKAVPTAPKPELSAVPVNKRAQQAPPPVKKMLAPARAAAPPDEVLPPILPPIESQSSYSAADIENDAILSAWLVEQTKRGKQAKKVDPELCCPIMLTTFTMDARQVQIKKKRKKTAATKKRKSKIVEALQEELEEEDEELEDDADIIEASPAADIDVVLYDDEIPLGQQEQAIENDDIDLDEEEEVDEESEDEVDEGDEGEDMEDIEDNDEEPHEPSVHSVEESEDDDSD